MGAEGVGVVAGLGREGLTLRLSRVKPVLGLDGVFSAKSTLGDPLCLGVGAVVGWRAFCGAFVGVLRKYLTRK